MQSIAIELTAHCNQKCAYCYNAWRADGGAAMGELPTQRLLAVLDRVLATEVLESVTLTGGDPFMRRDIHEIIDFINARGVGITIISNGGMITTEVAARLASQRVNMVQITLAGMDAATHDGVCGRGSYVRALAAIGNLVGAGVTVAGSYLCTKVNSEQARGIFERFAEMGVTQVAFNRFNPSGYSSSAIGDLLPTRTQVTAALQAVQSVAQTRGLRVVCTMPIPPCVVDYADYPSIEFGQCSAGDLQAEATLGPDGKVRLCTLQKDSVGDLSQSTLSQIVEHAGAQFRSKIPTFCRGCPASSSCLGGCGAAAEWVLGSANELDPFVAQHVTPDFWAKMRQRPIHGSGGPR